MSAIILPRNHRSDSWTAKAIGWLRRKHDRDVALNELRGLSDERLRDIGIERADVGMQMRTELAKIDLRRLGQIGLC